MVKIKKALMYGVPMVVVGAILYYLLTRPPEEPPPAPPAGGFVDRGDPGEYDFWTSHFSTDGMWHDLNLSGIVPAGAKAVSIFVSVQDGTAGNLLRFRKNGNTQTYNKGEIRTQSSNIWNSAEMIIPCDANRVIEYYATGTSWTSIFLVVKGWFM